VASSSRRYGRSLSNRSPGAASGLVISGIGVPTTILETIREDPPPAAVQAVAHLLGQAAV
jgi:hypothetical protein